jgi:DNA-binding MarR family transcriptional regulator
MRRYHLVKCIVMRYKWGDVMGEGLSPDRYQALAEFRYQLRRFLRFSEDAAREIGLEPQHHQLLLMIKGDPGGLMTIGALAERLQVHQHSAAELVARADARGLVRRTRGEQDRRKVFVSLTEEGEFALDALSQEHHRELQTLAPELIQILQKLIAD